MKDVCGDRFSAALRLQPARLRECRFSCRSRCCLTFDRAIHPRSLVGRKQINMQAHESKVPATASKRSRTALDRAFDCVSMGVLARARFLNAEGINVNGREEACHASSGDSASQKMVNYCPMQRWLILAVVLVIAATISAEPRLEITTTSLQPCVVDQPCILRLQASGGTGSLQWRIDRGSLPPGLQLDPAAGVITGSAVSAREYEVVIEV